VVGSCVGLVAPNPGEVFVGVNDRDVGNNKGSLEFGVLITLPTVEQWRTGGAFGCFGATEIDAFLEKLADTVASNASCSSLGGAVRTYVSKNRDLAEAFVQGRGTKRTSPQKSSLREKLDVMFSTMRRCKSNPEVLDAFRLIYRDLKD